MIKVFLADSYRNHAIMGALAQTMRREGYEVVSNWHDGEPVPEDRDPALARRRAEENLRGIRRADAALFFMATPSTTGGRHVELGYALGHHRAHGSPAVLVVGEPDNVYSALASYRAPNLQAALAWLQRQRDGG